MENKYKLEDLTDARRLLTLTFEAGDDQAKQVLLQNPEMLQRIVKSTNITSNDKYWTWAKNMLQVDVPASKSSLKDQAVQALKDLGADDEQAEAGARVVGRMVLDHLKAQYEKAAGKSEDADRNATKMMNLRRVGDPDGANIDWGWARYFQGEAHGYRMAADLIDAMVEA